MEKEAASFQVFPVRAVRFPVQKHTVYARKTYGSASGNVGFTEWKRRKCAEVCRILHHNFRKTICSFKKKSYFCCTTLMVQYNDF